MSLEDIWEDESFLPMLMLVLVIVFVVTIIGVLISKAANSAHYASIPITKLDDVTVVSKLQTPLPYSPSVMTYSVTFQTERGSRIQLKIREATQFNSLIEGDVGSLIYKDDLFVGFNRK